MQTTDDMKEVLHTLKWLKDRSWNYQIDMECVKVWVINDTGSASVYGELVEASTAIDKGFKQSAADGNHPIGIVAEGDIADGAWCPIIVSGAAQVLLKDTTASTRGYWVFTSDAAGRANATTANPPGGGFVQLDQHMREIDHCLESKTAGTDVLAICIIHFN